MTVISLKKRLHGCILDVGGGGEGVIGRLYPRQVVAIDHDEDELMDAPGDFERLLMDATKLTFPDAFFDAATFFYSLMFMTADEQRAALAEAARVLRPGGRLCVWDCAFDRAYPEPFSVNLTIDLDGEILHTTYGICKLDGQSMAQIAEICRALSLRPLRAEESAVHFYLEFEKDETVSKGTQKVGDLFFKGSSIA